MLIVLVLVGCATSTKTDWAARVGHYSHDQAVLELGPPDKSATLKDGGVVAEWVTQSVQSVGPTGPYWVRPGDYYGGGAGGYAPANFPAWHLRLIFAPDGTLAGWKKFTR